jgi:hypothetical protein
MTLVEGLVCAGPVGRPMRGTSNLQRAEPTIAIRCGSRGLGNESA